MSEVTELATCGVGETLARARQTQGLALADVAQQLKFAQRHLEALEQGRFEALPGSTFARGMVRGYARLLKLDPEPLLASIAGRVDAPDSDQLAARFHQPVPFSDSGRRSTFLYLALSLGVLGFVGFIAYEWHRESTAPAQLAAAPGAEPMRMLAMPAQPASAPRESVGAPREIATAPPAREIAKDLPAAPAPAPRIADAPKSIAGARIVLRCEEESWIEVKDSADRILIQSLNAAGSERVVQGRPPFTLVIGNAQHVRVSYNDRPVDLSPHTKVEVARFTLK